MTPEERKRFTVISNDDMDRSEFREKHRSYQTNPLTEKLMKFVNNEGGRKFSVQDLLR